MLARGRALPPWSLEKAVRVYIEWTVEACGGSVSEAARVLRLPRRTLQRKRKKAMPKF